MQSTPTTSLKEKARDYASGKHAATNHFYGEHPYAFHLAMVADFAERFLSTTSFTAEEQDAVVAAAWCHDLIEDARETYNDVKAQMGEAVAEMVYRVTNEKGRNRAERANPRYYAGIKAHDGACYVKICDRLANLQNSKNTGSRMFQRYRNEAEKFRNSLYTPGKFEALWERMDELLELS